MFDYLINPLVKFLLRSPLHGLLSDRLLLLTFTGRKSGRTYTTPVGYIREDDTLYVITEAPWWKNMRRGAPVTVRVKGRRRSGHAEATDDPEVVARAIQIEVQKHGAAFAEQRFGLSLSSDHPSVAEIADAISDIKVVTIELAS
jgi:deazaflavin-dependent oxidoreductase (nitroreductase family)